MSESSAQESRLNISYWEGINAEVNHTIAKITELSHAENARSKIIGTIEKREGQLKYGTNPSGSPLSAIENYGLTKFVNNGSNAGVFRVTNSGAQDPSIISLYVFDMGFVGDYPLIGNNVPALMIKTADNVSVTEPSFFSRLDTNTVIIDGTSMGSQIFSLGNSKTWVELAGAKAMNIIGNTCSFARYDGKLMMVNHKDYNRAIGTDGTTVVDSTQAGDTFNSPRAGKVAYYKNRLYLANFTRNGVNYPTTVMRSSYPIGIVALFNGDVTAVDGSGNWVIPVTENKYFYIDSGMSSYEVYRGYSLIATVTLDSIQETTVTATGAHVTFSPGFSSFLSADEIWVAGTYTGDKQYRWVQGPSSISRDVKQYDTFKLVGGDEDPINMMELIGNVLMIANRNVIMTWNDYMLENMDLGIGCVSPNGYVKLMGSLYFVHYSGIYSTTGGVPVLISRKIKQYLRGASKTGLESSCAGFKGLSVFFTIGDVVLYNRDGSYWKTLSSVCLEYHVGDQNWYVHTNVPASSFATFIDQQGVERLLISHSGGGHFVKEFLSGKDDDGEDIFFRVDTQQLQLMRKPETYGEATTIVAEIDRGASVEGFVSIDDGDFFPIKGTFSKGISYLKITSRDTKSVQPLASRKIKISFRDSSKQTCKLVQASVGYAPTNIVAPTENRYG